ncbi:MAG TPA: hypothetical protein VM103_00640 [Candidatus Paceibacterota bacterium]|nr:hypothetical protein [Candidatus Paceibacterota bacterium]
MGFFEKPRIESETEASERRTREEMKRFGVREIQPPMRTDQERAASEEGDDLTKAAEMLEGGRNVHKEFPFKKAA